jgi:hypothetical protein|tara:strand:+ start:377 stop:790 length:414 start_codon:yes stop_codon:yes gene_type:complete
MKTISKLKKELDKWFSLYIRLRDATDTGLCQCVTCGKVGHYKTGGMQNGHFQSRRFLATRWSEDGNCEVQCQKCNIWEQGMQFRFSIYIEAKYGEGTAEHLEGLARTTVKISRIEYEEKITYYKSLVDKLKKEKGIE